MPWNQQDGGSATPPGELSEMNPAQRLDAGRDALEQLERSGHAGAVVDYTASHTPDQVTDRMIGAAAGDGVSGDDAAAFVTWGALDSGTRGDLVAEAGGGAGPSGAGDGGFAAPAADGGFAAPTGGGFEGGGTDGSSGGGAWSVGADGTATPPSSGFDGAPGDAAAPPPRDYVRAEDIGASYSWGPPSDDAGDGAADPGDHGVTVPDDSMPLALPSGSSPGSRGGGDIPSPSDDGLEG
jgi:hypothetical protein